MYIDGRWLSAFPSPHNNSIIEMIMAQFRRAIHAKAEKILAPNLLSMARTHLKNFIIFSIIGVLNTAIYAVTFLYLQRADLNFSALKASAIAYALATLFAFTAHSRFSFQQKSIFQQQKFLKFIAVQLALMAANSLVAFIMVDIQNLEKWTPLLISITIFPVISYALNKALVFK